MSFFAQVGQGLAYAHREAAKHITAENLNRGAQEVWKNIDSAAQHVSQHVTQENIHRAAEEIRKNWDGVARGVAEAAEIARPHVERAVVSAGDAIRGAAGQVTAENIAIGAGIVQGHVNNAASHVGREIGAASNVLHHRVGEAASWAMDENNIRGFSQGAQATAQQAANAAKGSPIAFSIASLGLVVLAAPAVITTPIIAAAGLMGFTSGGIAASSIAAGLHSGIGNVVAGSGFATVQSAGAGGYGLGVMTGLAQTAGGVMAAAGTIVGGALAWFRG
ncbi:hypothetical protein Trco_006330 [Trichoderma cornu-damae]|uniref:Uncharacterized protein n=1 Tax=Trichoderma cornu-damae TaxID=654480 RepID=A0A9P8QKC8_9HYPO|nr:hypothetical protein Trco_006330 [Trichoderma cornu-damae]